MWAQVINTLIGFWLMIAPGIFGFDTVAADNGHIIGPIIMTFSITAYWECTRGMRKWNIPLAIWLLLAPWILGYDQVSAIRSDLLSGVLILIFSLIKGGIKNRYGGGWSSLWQKNPLHVQDAEKLRQEESG